MFGVPLFRASSLTAECDQCRSRFEPSRGGVCSVCQRILCGEHLHGSWAHRLSVELWGRPAVCVECRARRGAG